MALITTLSGTPITTLGGTSLITLGSAAPPLFDIDFFRQRIGLASGDTSKDTLIQAALTVSLELIENYLDRKLEYGTYKEMFVHISQGTVQLKAYPVDTIIGVTSASGRSQKYCLDKVVGIIFEDSWLHEHEYEVEYTGGYKTLPVTIETAVMLVFDIVFPALESSGGVASTGGIKSAKIGDLSISYDTGAAAKSSSDVSLIPAVCYHMLDPYKRFST